MSYSSILSNPGSGTSNATWRQFGLNAIPPTYAPPRPPPAGKPLTNRQKLALVATILLIISVLALLVWLAQHHLEPLGQNRSCFPGRKRAWRLVAMSPR